MISGRQNEAKLEGGVRESQSRLFGACQGLFGSANSITRHFVLIP